jgi:hypothetical protein
LLTILVKLFVPEQYDSGRSSDFPHFQAAFPSQSIGTVAGLPKKYYGDYSSGYCPGFSPGSLLSGKTKTDSGTKIETNIH